jgi:uncharacterized membrane protein YvbJ
MARYCSKCGKENADDAMFCKNCGAAITATAEPYAGPKKQRNDDCFGTEGERCFGVPNGGIIVGIVFGILLILAGVALFYGWAWNWNWVGAAILVLIGALIILGAYYRSRRR